MEKCTCLAEDYISYGGCCCGAETGDFSGTLKAAGSAFYRNELDGALCCKIEGDELVLRIGIERLAFAATLSDRLRDYEVIDQRELAQDVLQRMESEPTYDGTMACGFIMDMIEDAQEMGSTAIILPNT